MLRGSYTITVFASYKSGDEGVLLSNGDNLGGYAIYVENGKLKYHYNHLTYKHFELESNIEIPEETISLRLILLKRIPIAVLVVF